MPNIVLKLAQGERVSIAAKLQEAKVDRDAVKVALQAGNQTVTKLQAQLDEVDEWLVAQQAAAAAKV
ncbi:hypothetical protein [Variovorax sp. PAMC 28711]|uniref:hypothetical protein n=1 Tax=Variovorax sp. PAMC 28711 TaxID=1795631 RepID=UPI00078EA6DA|nr:hypothetical protein [Variovorax sp. PAMC 28711]AMM23004.1 hypothetical protein AX767_00365 [Variovorax sp. PAMC 28711]